MKKNHKIRHEEQAAQWFQRHPQDGIGASAANVEQLRRMKGLSEHEHDSVAERILNRPFRNARVFF